MKEFESAFAFETGLPTTILELITPLVINSLTAVLVAHPLDSVNNV